MTETLETHNKKKNFLTSPFFWSIVLFVALNFLLVSFYKPAKPEISVAAESLIFDVQDGIIEEKPWFTIPGLGAVYLTNSLMAIPIAFIVIILMAIAVQRETRDGELTTHGVSALVECLMSLLGGMADSSVEEKDRKYVYPWFFGIFIYVAVINLTKLLPIFETIGFAVPVAEGGFLANTWGKNFIAISGNAASEGQLGYRLVSFLRGGPTELNCTLAIALCAVIGIQIIGVQVKGLGYFNRFINIHALKHNKQTGFVDFIVGILELVAEFAKIASFGFRLFGNMFAGMVLVMFLGFIVPWVAGSVMMLYEVFVGILQAFIFGMLTAVFAGMAVREE